MSNFTFPENDEKFHKIWHTVKPVLSGHSKIDKTKILMTNGTLMKVESIAECSPWSILQLLLTCIKQQLVLKIIFWSFWEWPF